MAARSVPGAVVSNANLKATIFNLVGEEHFDREVSSTKPAAVRLNNSSSQVYMALKPDERIDETWAICCSVPPRPLFRTELLLSRDITSRTYSFYYPRTRPGSDRCLIVSSTNANYSRLGRSVERRIRGQQAGPGRNHARRTRQATCRTSASSSTTPRPRRR